MPWPHQVSYPPHQPKVEQRKQREQLGSVFSDCAYLWSCLFIVSLRAGESSVTNVKKDYSNGIKGTD